jgi:transcription antitermination factor NusG
MYICGSTAHWYALRIAAGRERAVAAQLSHKGYEEFLPVYRTKRQWSDRVKELELPLFPGYIFCRFDLSRRLPILITPGVKLIVGCGRTPIPVKDEEIDDLRKVVTSGASAEPWRFLEVGQRVAILEGSLCGVEGILLQVKNSWRIVLSVELLRRSVAVEVDRACVMPVTTGSEPVHTLQGMAVAAGAEAAWMRNSESVGTFHKSSS